ncbi:hypothetical protein BGX27_005386 [Mortierella sp. AM989]|nr:hypothetical protein BGX27_005386 [Mortierella sp. AM989]
MGLTSPERWFTIELNEPYYIIPEQSSSIPSEPASDSQRDRLDGTIILCLTKPTKIKSLSLTFSGLARTSFHFDSSSIPGAKPCVSFDKNKFGCILIDYKQIILSSEINPSNVLPAGTHRFPFSFQINEYLPAVISSKPININYQVTASLQLPSILPFGSHHNISKPVILLQKDELPTDNLFNTAVIHVSSKDSARVSSKITIPCAVFPQAGTIPLMMNLFLKGNATTATKISIELVESVFARSPSDSNRGEGRDEVLIDERLVSRQNCPTNGWPSSTTEEPVTIPKRLMFKVPQLALSAWSKSEEPLTLSCPRSSLDKGFCHVSGIFDHANIRIAHTIRVVVYVRGLSNDAESIVENGSGESETTVWIVGNQEYKDDGIHPPSYYRSFSTKLVEGDKIQEIDQQALEALQDDLNCSILPPYYEESLAGSSADSSSSFVPWSDDSRRTSLDQLSLDDSLAESNDTYANDLAAYTERYSNTSPIVLAM